MIVAALVAVVVIGSVLAVGAVHVPVLVGVAVLAGAAASTALWCGGRWPLPAIICAALAAWSALQALPLPASVVALAAPRNAAVWQGAFALLHDPQPRWVPVSLDPGASWVEALKWLTYALAFVAAVHLARRRGAGWGISVVFVSSVIAGFATIAHGLLGATKVFGIYQPVSTPAPWHIGPLINPNNLSGYLTLGTLVGLGALMARRRRAPAWLIGLGIATNVAVNVTAASRAGVIALPVGVLILGIAMSRQRARQTASAAAASRSGWWLVALAFAGGAVLAVLGVTVDAWKELWSQNIEKLTAARFVVPLLKEHAWVGTGRGAFETVFPAYRNAPGNVVFTHAESFPIDWAAGWGIPVAAAALVGFAWSLRRSAVAAHRSVVAAAAWAGLLALFLQNLADLGLEVPALPIAVAVVWGTMLGSAARRSRSGPATEPGGSSWAWARAAGPIVVLAALALTALRSGRADSDSDRRAVQQRLAAVNSADGRTALRDEISAAIRRHPAEPYFPLIGALLAWKHRDEDPMPWLSWALERDITNGRAHLLTAEVVAARGNRSQALFELRLAVQDDFYLAEAAAPLAVRWAKSCDDLAALAPGSFGGAHVLSALSVAIPPPQAQCRGALVAEALKRAPDAPWPRKLASSSLLARMGDPKAEPPCSGQRRAACEAELEDHARALEAAEPKMSTPVQLRAQLLRLNGKPAEGAKLLETSCGAYDDREGCLNARVWITAAIPSPNDLPSAVRDYVAAACLNATSCAAAATSMGDMLLSRGDAGTAAIYYERATREAPTEARWSSLAEAAGRSGAHAQAASALEHLAQLRGGADAELQRRIQDERAKALGLH